MKQNEKILKDVPFFWLVVLALIMSLLILLVVTLGSNPASAYVGSRCVPSRKVLTLKERMAYYWLYLRTGRKIYKRIADVGVIQILCAY